MSLHSVYNIVALAAFALGAAALITAAILFVSQRLWEVMSDRRKRPASAHRTGSHTAKAHTPPQPVGGWNTTALNRSANAADGTKPMNGQANVALGTMPMNGQSSFAPGTMPMNGQANTAPGTRPMNSQANTANSTTLLNSQADVAAGTTMLKTKPAAPPTASGGTVPLKPPTASGGTVALKPSTASGGTVQLKPSTAPGGTNPLKAPPNAPGGTTMRRVTPGASATRVRRTQDAVSAHVLGVCAAQPAAVPARPNRSEPPAAFRIVRDEVVVHTSEVI